MRDERSNWFIFLGESGIRVLAAHPLGAKTEKTFAENDCQSPEAIVRNTICSSPSAHELWLRRHILLPDIIAPPP
jgi:hypothetical protein